MRKTLKNKPLVEAIFELRLQGMNTPDSIKYFDVCIFKVR